MAWSIQRQAEQYGLDVPPPTHSVPEHRVADMLRPGNRIHPNTMNHRQAYYGEDTVLEPSWLPPSQKHEGPGAWSMGHDPARGGWYHSEGPPPSAEDQARIKKEDDEYPWPEDFDPPYPGEPPPPPPPYNVHPSDPHGPWRPLPTYKQPGGGGIKNAPEKGKHERGKHRLEAGEHSLPLDDPEHSRWTESHPGYSGRELEKDWGNAYKKRFEEEGKEPGAHRSEARRTRVSRPQFAQPQVDWDNPTPIRRMYEEPKVDWDEPPRKHRPLYEQPKVDWED